MTAKKALVIGGTVVGARALYLLVQGQDVTWRSMLGMSPAPKKLRPVTGITYAIPAGPPAPGTTYATAAGPPDPTTQYATPAGPPDPTDATSGLGEFLDAELGEDDE